MRFISLLGVLLACTACAPTTGLEKEERDYRRIEYRETVFLPATRACSRAGGFIILEDSMHSGYRPESLTYNEMRLAVARGCGGI